MEISHKNQGGRGGWKRFREPPWKHKHAGAFSLMHWWLGSSWLSLADSDHTILAKLHFAFVKHALDHFMGSFILLHLLVCCCKLSTKLFKLTLSWTSVLSPKEFLFVVSLFLFIRAPSFAPDFKQMSWNTFGPTVKERIMLIMIRS